MKTRWLHVVLLTCFAVAVGDFGFRTWNPSVTPEYMVEGVVRPLLADNREEPKKHLYLRGAWRLTEPPEQAWLQLVGHDALEVFVNGRRAGVSPPVGHGRLGAIVVDITPLMHEGENSVAVHAPQLILDRPPAVAVDGEYRFADGAAMSLADAQNWRVSNVYDRRGAFWYETAFEDKHWAKPTVGRPVHWRAQVEAPPRSITQPRRSQWITPTSSKDGAAVMARSFNVAGTPREGWLRVLATGSYRVAINGYLVAHEQPDLGLAQSREARERTFDVSPLLRSGANTISILAETPGEPPRVRADLEAATIGGERTYVATDRQWKAAAGYPADWLTPNLDTPEWEAARAEIGYQGFVPRSIIREMAQLRPPVSFWIARFAVWVGWVAVSGLIGAVGSGFVAWLLNLTRAPKSPLLPPGLAILALLPSTVAAAAGSLMTWDLAWSAHDIYHPLWLLGLWLLVGMQWLLLLVVNAGRAAGAAIARPSRRRLGGQWAAIALCWFALAGAALWLRVRDITAEPIHHDEVTAYGFTQSIFEHGFPGGQVHPDIPFGYAATSELCYYFNALCALFVDDPILVLRIPSVIFSMGTLVLLGVVGWRWFNPYVGFVAAALYAFSPHAIGVANLGRYLSQVQFFTLLTMWLTYEAVRGTGRPNVRVMWSAALSFIAMYLSWEGSGMFGVGLALAVLFQRRRHLRPLLAEPQLYMASAVVLVAVGGQNAHRIMQQTQRLWYGEGISALALTPMWRYPFFQYDYYFINASWTRNAFLPMLALMAACLMAIGHRWRGPLRFSLICLIANAMLMVGFLPVRTGRYSYHLMPMLILIAAAVVVAGAAAAVRSLQASALPRAYRWYASAATAGVAAAIVALASGWLVYPTQLGGFASSSYGVKQLRIPDWEGPTRHLRQHLQPGDVVIAIMPHAQNYLFAVQHVGGGEPRTVDHWLESRLIVQAAMGDSTDVPRDRRSGANMLYNLDQVKQLFAENERVWYCTMRYAQSKINDSPVSKYLREHMDVVYEDFGTALMLRDKNHRPAPVRLEEEEAGHMAADYFLR